MIDMKDVVILDLPSIKLSDRGFIPNEPGVYFVIAIFPDDPEQDHIAYIGKSKRLAMRWQNHHKLDKFLAFPDADIRWIPCSRSDDLESIEQAAIDYFNPPLNGRLKQPELVAREIIVPLRLSKAEKEKAQQIAAAEGMPLATWLRRQIIIAPDPPKKQAA